MKKFEVITVCDCYTRYIVEAETLDEAIEKYGDEHLSLDEYDFKNEEVIYSQCGEVEK